MINRTVNFLFKVNNYLYFRILSLYKRITIGNNFCIHGYVNVSIADKSILSIGDDFYFSNARRLNPICRNIRGSIRIEPGAAIVIGNNVRIGGDCIVIDSDCHSLNYVHRRGAVSDMLNTKSKQITIEDDVMIGARCIILKGVVIGARSVIGAGAVVTRSIPADCIACGNPAKIIKRI
jgi:acetyltransferase-like isoleucine patch superfamily enzyme